MKRAAEFAAQVQRHVLRLRSWPFGDLEREVAAKRCAWLEHERPRLHGRLVDRPRRPRLAFELLFGGDLALGESPAPRSARANGWDLTPGICLPGWE